MNTHIELYSNILAKVKFFSKQLKLKLCKSTGRKLAISGEETIALALFKQNTGIPTKKKIWDIFQPKECYKTLCVEMNRFALSALLVLNAILKWNQIYNTRMLIELNFRNLKMFYAFITSVPRSIDGYFANYIYSLLAYVLG